MVKSLILFLGLILNSPIFADCNQANNLCQKACKMETEQISDCMDSCKAGFDKCEYVQESSTDKCGEFQRQCSSKCFKVKNPEKCEKACQAGYLKCP